MSALRLHTKIPISGNGFVELLVDVPDLKALSAFDRDFVRDVIDKISPWIPVAPEPPAVLRGVLREAGGRP